MIRTDFVSNSSSSSFILDDNIIFSGFDITKQDIENALMDLYGKNKYDKYLEESKKYIEKDEEPHRPFYVYDLYDKKDKKECLDKWGGLCRGWDAPNNRNMKKWDDFVCAMQQVYEYAHGKESIWLSTLNYDPKYDSEFDKKERKKIPEHVAKVYQEVRKELEIKTMFDCLNDKMSRFYIHFEDNEAWQLKGAQEYNAKEMKEYGHWKGAKSGNWFTEFSTCPRVIEILIKYFIEKGKINLNEDDYLPYWKIPDDSWIKRSKEYKGIEYYFQMDDFKKKHPVIKDIVDDICDTMQAIGHEG